MGQVLELADIQAIVLRNRPMPYHGAYVYFRIDDAGHARELLRRLIPKLTTSSDWQTPADRAWINVVFTYLGLARLGVKEEILAGFPVEFRVPMSRRSEFLGDVGPSAPEHWDYPFGSPDFHVVLTIMAPDRAGLEAKLELGRNALKGLEGVATLGHQEVTVPANFREHFGFVDGISRPFIEGQGGAPLPGQGEPLKAGEFFLGYVNEAGEVATGPGPRAFWRNGTFLSIRKLHQDVAGWRRFLRERARQGGDAARVAAKMVGRWPSGCPLALAPNRDEPSIAGDPTRNNDFLYYDDDRRGTKTPPGSHIRRVNPRDALRDGIVDVRKHRVFRRGSAYGPMLPEGVLEDDGLARGTVIAFVNANPGRQFEFVQSQWINDGNFISMGMEKDPIAGTHVEPAQYTFPERPTRRRLAGLSSFVVTRGGEHMFLPGIGGVRWLAESSR